MSLRIRKIENKGGAKQEYLLIDVVDDCDLATYMAVDTTFDDEGKVSNQLRHVYWFPSKWVRKGEFVALFTGTGRNRRTEDEKGRIVHRFFWNLDHAVWNNDGDAAVLLQVNCVDNHKVSEAKP